jgi:hypothetical protein
MPRAKYPYDTELAGPLFRFLEMDMGKGDLETCRRRLHELINAGVPVLHPDAVARVLRPEIRNLQGELRELYELAFDDFAYSGPDPNLPAIPLARLAAFHALAAMLPKRGELRARPRRRCVVCKDYFIPLRMTQTAHPSCYELKRRPPKKLRMSSTR